MPPAIDGSSVHLVHRFFDVLSAPPLRANEVTAIGAWLSEAEDRLFFEQPRSDQRHGYEAALSIVAAGIRDTRVIGAALLHDIGKRHAGLGVVARSATSVLIAIKAPLPSRMAKYRDHGRIAAEELAAIGSADLVVEFARHHHHSRPAGMDLAAWAALTIADAPPKAKVLVRRPITWQSR